VTRLYSSICTRGERICLTFFLKLSELLLLLLLLLLSDNVLLSHKIGHALTERIMVGSGGVRGQL